ncbi:MAG: DUF411 domain-containing protein, partial [Aquincola tertiaricarbonis]
MKRRNVLCALAGAAVLPAAWAKAGMPSVQVFKDPNCGCCGAWVQHLEKAGFQVKVTEVTDTAAARSRLGMPSKFGGCHSATVEGYVIEGHVPAAEIQQLLLKRPAALGLAVPGMPVGSPGMEMGPRVDPYDVLLIDRQGGA